MKKLFKYGLLVVTITVLILSLAIVHTLYSPIVEHRECYAAGGIWRTFSNGCVDWCYEGNISDRACTTAITPGCDCGRDKCWNGASCMPDLSEMDNENNALHENITNCGVDDDCILVIAGCRYCDDCKTHSIMDSDVIAVNKNLYKCPPKPKNIACVACIGTVDFDVRNYSICVNNTCQKKAASKNNVESENP